MNEVTINALQEKIEKVKQDIDSLRLTGDASRKIEVLTEYKSYYINDTLYTYELPNDNQIVTSTHMINTKSIRRTRNDTDLYIVSYRVEKYPIYMFPCTNNIDYVSAYNIKEFKINNRITINIKTDEDSNHTVFVEYKHSDNVELDRINETIGRLLHRI